MSVFVLCAPDEVQAANRLADAAGLPLISYQLHHFPDAELKLTLPFAEAVPRELVLYRSLDKPNDKLVELLLIARHARLQGVQKIWLVAPYLAYMRQDIAFNPGEIVSQKIIGQFLAELFDGVITVDPHLHRISELSEAIPQGAAIALSGASRLAEVIASNHRRPLLIGPDAEALQHTMTGGRAQRPRRALADAPRWPGLYLLCAMGSRGITLAPWCAEQLAMQINREPSPVDPALLAALDPARFAIKNVRRQGSARERSTAG